MANLTTTLIKLNSAGTGSGFPVSAPALLIVTLLYLVAVLSVPLSSPQTLVWLGIYPVVVAEMTGFGFLRLFVKSLWVLPLVLMIAIFNPIINTTTAFSIGGIAVSAGWVSFISVVLRGILALQAVLLLVRAAGFYDMCNALRKMGMPRILVTQILLTYRYMSVLVEEALWMHRARQARGFGRRNYPLKQWAVMVGQLLLRSWERASRIYYAMQSRGFTGTMPCNGLMAWNVKSVAFTVVWASVIVAIRLFC